MGFRALEISHAAEIHIIINYSILKLNDTPKMVHCSTWKKPYKLEREAFAHMFEAVIRNDTQKKHYLS